MRHPNTIAIYDYGRTPEGVFYYAMELLEGLNLDDLVAHAGPLPASRVVHLIAQACSSLEEAHALSLVHRDVKPANVFVVGRPGAWDWVKVLDFGLVKELKEDSDGLSRAGQIAGTPLYMAPEAILSPSSVGPASDIYALAATAYFLVTGTHVFDGLTAAAICAAHLDDEPEPPSARLKRTVPPRLEAIILRGLAKRPADRFASVVELRDALLACDIEPWSEADARAFWRDVPPPKPTKGDHEHSLGTAATVKVDLTGRFDQSGRS